jgi:hypothetical protein
MKAPFSPAACGGDASRASAAKWNTVAGGRIRGLKSAWIHVVFMCILNAARSTRARHACRDSY